MRIFTVVVLNRSLSKLVPLVELYGMRVTRSYWFTQGGITTSKGGFLLRSALHDVIHLIL